MFTGCLAFLIRVLERLIELSDMKAQNSSDSSEKLNYHLDFCSLRIYYDAGKLKDVSHACRSALSRGYIFVEETSRMLCFKS